MTAETSLKRCQFRLSSDCRGEPEVHFTNGHGLEADICLPCGKEYQRKYPHRVEGISLRALVIS